MLWSFLSSNFFTHKRLIELLGLLTGLGLHELCHLVYPRLLTGFAMMVFTNLSLMEFQVRYLVLFLVFSVIDDLEWFWLESLQKNIQLMLEFLRNPFLVLHFSCYTLMTFLTMLSVILLSMLMILLYQLFIFSEFQECIFQQSFCKGVSLNRFSKKCPCYNVLVVFSSWHILYTFDV